VKWVWWIQCECGLGKYADSRSFVYVKGEGTRIENIKILIPDIIRELRKIEQEPKWGRERILGKPPKWFAYLL
jgi:hypothetical protein